MCTYMFLQNLVLTWINCVLFVAMLVYCWAWVYLRQEDIIYLGNFLVWLAAHKPSFSIMPWSLKSISTKSIRMKDKSMYFTQYNSYLIHFGAFVNNKINTLESVSMKTYFYFACNMKIRVFEELRALISHFTTTCTKE